MTIKKAIKRLQGWLDEGYYKINKQDSDWSDDKEALELAIRCMNNKESEGRSQGEWIRKENVIALLNKWADGYCYIEIPTDDAIKAIKEMKNGEEKNNEKDSNII